MDIVRSLTQPLPVAVIAQMMGIPLERADDFKRWSDAIVGMVSNRREDDSYQRADELRRYLLEVVRERLSQPDTMDGFALDYYWNYVWWVGRKPTANEMLPIAAMYTPETAAVVNMLAREYAVFTRWFSET